MMTYILKDTWWAVAYGRGDYTTQVYEAPGPPISHSQPTPTPSATTSPSIVATPATPAITLQVLQKVKTTPKPVISNPKQPTIVPPVPATHATTQAPAPLPTINFVQSALVNNNTIYIAVCVILIAILGCTWALIRLSKKNSHVQKSDLQY